MPKISYIIPCYFNEKNIPHTINELILCEKSFENDVDFEYITIDDGSKDNTFEELKKCKTKYPNKIKIIKLSGNYGAHNALLAGMNHASGDCHVILAADLQDPPELVNRMYEFWRKGVKFVIANRSSRYDPMISRLFSSFFHFLFRKIAIKNIPKGGFDLVLFDEKIRKEIVRMDERNTHQIFLMTSLKYEYVNIPYERTKREIGKSKWTFSKKIKLFIDSFVSFSYMPIRLISLTGLIMGFVSIIYALFIIYNKISGLVTVDGWSTIMVVILLVSSFQMIALGILGEYIWRTLDVSRKRPNYVIEEII